jgi:RsiW-degrading membrane proteinase PrsW (M82 family)
MDNKHPGGSMKQPLVDTPTRSQLLPLQTNWRTVMSKGYFWPGVITVAAVVFLFGFLQSGATYDIRCLCEVPDHVVPGGIVTVRKWVDVKLPLYIIVLALYITGGLAFAAYRIIGKPAPLWLIPAVAVVTYFLVDSPLFGIAHLLDFGVKELGNDFSLSSIVKGFFAAGLPEEVIKAVPVALGVWAARRIPERGHFLSAFRVVEPLDGILIGVASGLGFTLNETLLQYVPQQIVFADWHLVRDGMASQLMIPRVLQNIAGHGAWAGIFGYYIGMAAIRPASAKKLILIGLGIVALLHGAWDSNGGTIVQLVIAIATFAMLAGVIMKARELSPNRSQLIRSQVLDGVPGAGAFAAGTAGAGFSATGTAGAGFSATGASGTAASGTAASGSAASASAASGTVASGKLAPRPAPSQTAASGVTRSETWGQRSETWEDAPRVEQLEVAGARIPLTADTRLTESQIPTLKSGAGDGVVATVSANPHDPKVLGLKNLSLQTWQVETVGRGTRELGPGRSIRIERGVRIQLGSAPAVIK